MDLNGTLRPKTESFYSLPITNYLLQKAFYGKDEVVYTATMSHLALSCGVRSGYEALYGIVAISMSFPRSVCSHSMLGSLSIIILAGICVQGLGILWSAFLTSHWINN